jgi:hypothetical protein
MSFMIKHAKGSPVVCSFISGLEHDREDVLAQAKRQPHNQGIKELSPLQNKLIVADSRPEIVQDNFCEQAVRRRKSTYLDVSMSSLMTLWMSMKVLPKLLQRRGLHVL